MLIKGAVHEIGKLGSNGPFWDADHSDMVHFGLSGFYSGVLVNQSIAPQGLDDDGGRTCPMTAGLVRRRTAPLKGAVRKIGKFEVIIIFSIPKLTIRDQLGHFVDNPFN